MINDKEGDHSSGFVCFKGEIYLYDMIFNLADPVNRLI